MAEDIPHRPERRLSTDTMSTVDVPAPPYGLVDATHRPGSILDVPVSSERGEIASPMRSGYRIRVGNLEIRNPRLWNADFSKYQLLEVGPVDHVHSPDITVIIATFEKAINLGHSLLILLLPCIIGSPNNAEIFSLYCRMDSMWMLCTTVGATLCNHELVLPLFWKQHLSSQMSLICEHLLPDSIEKVEQISLTTGTDAASDIRPAPSAAQLEVVERLATKIIKEQGPALDFMISTLTHLNWRFQLEKFKD